MSIARHHAEWLSLLEISGPFLSMPVLLHAFPQGLDAHDPDAFRALKLACEEWQDNQGGLRPDPAIHTVWIRFVLGRTLELPPQAIAEGQAIPPSLKAVIAEHGETLRPDLVITNPALSPGPSPSQGEGRPRLLIQIYPPAQDLDKPVANRRWKASPAMRMMELLRACDVRLGLVTNGERWMLVDSPRDGTTGFISWYASLWLEEHITLRAFRSLLGAHRFFSVPDDETLEALLAESATDQQEVTAQLGYQVRRAVEVLIQSIDRADQDRGRTLLTGVTEPRLYEAALTVMMRLVFLFSAEERKLLLLGDPLYDQHYAVSTLRAQLREAADQHGEEVLERRLDAWCRLLATFRAVYGGIAHPDLKLPAYGGSLFDPDRFPFLEGRAARTSWTDIPADPLPINNRTVLHLLDALQMLQVKVPGGTSPSGGGGPAEARRLGFRALDIEQIGHVYESLLDHTAVRATELVLGLAGTRDKEPEVALAELEAQLARGEEAFVEFLVEATGRSESALRKAINGGAGAGTGVVTAPLRDQHLRAACGNDESLYRRVLPFAGLVRNDDFDVPVVIPAGSVYVTAGADQRSTGTHYTPRSLTEPVVQHTLEPLVYIGPAEGKPREEWQLRPAAELLDLKICDMAMGSGAFLVQADRYLAERLVEAWEECLLRISDFGLRSKETQNEGSAEIRNQKSEIRPRITPEGKPSTGAPGETLIPDDVGGDERLSLARRIVAERCLYGVDKNPLAVEMAKLSLWLVTLAKDRPFTFLDHALKCGDSLVGADEDMFQRWAHGLKGSEMTLFDEQLRGQLTEARQKRRELESFEVKDVRDAERKAALLAEADRALERVKLGCDLLIGVRLLDLPRKEKEARLNTLLLAYMAGKPLNTPEAQGALEAAHKVKAFHWPFEFPEIFEQDGFIVFVGNPPFLGGLRISTMLGDDYFRYLREAYPSSTGTADLCAFFFLRAFDELRPNGTFGLIATNTIAQGDTRATGLDHIAKSGGTIYVAESSTPWPGVAAVSVSLIHAIKGDYGGAKVLDGRPVSNISSLLDSTSALGQPKALAQNKSKSFIGSYVLGMGFVLEPAEAQRLIAIDRKNAKVIRPYLTGEDLTSRPDQSPSRWVINFYDWPLAKAEQYPDCIEIVRSLVKPQRDGVKRERNKERWWLYAENRPGLYGTIAPLKQVLVVARTAKYLGPVFVPNGMVYNENTVVFAFDSYTEFSVIQSTIHLLWTQKYSSTLETRQGYRPTDCFETFPFPLCLTDTQHAIRSTLSAIGEAYHEHRRQIMLARQEGLTKTYNRFHDPDEHSADIARLRELHVEMDQAVAVAYGWDDPSASSGQVLELGHGFHETAQGVRYTISEPARREVLARLLALNHQRHEEEQSAGSDQPSAKKTTKGKGRGAKKSKKQNGDEREQLGLL